MNDPTPTVVAYLDARLAADVYGGRLPASAVDTRPSDTVVVRFDGNPGSFGRGYQTYGDVRIDIRCLGATDIAAVALNQQVVTELKALRRHVGDDGTVVHWAQPAGGGGLSEDPDTGWPQVLSSWQLLIDG